jgi:hypothetical protein
MRKRRKLEFGISNLEFQMGGCKWRVESGELRVESGGWEKREGLTHGEV